MLTRGELRAIARTYLAETRGGIWSDANLDEMLNQACNEHAVKANSVRKTIYVSTLYGVQEYVLPSDFGELRQVRFQYEGHQGNRGLTYVAKSVAQDWSYGETNLGEPDCYYKDEDHLLGDKIGLFPVPNKPRVFDRSFEGSCPNFVPMLDDRDAVYPDTPTEFTNVGEFSIEALPNEVENPEVDPCRVWVSQVDLYIRREGIPYPGNIFLDIREPDNDANIHLSKMIPAQFIDARPGWIPFDFTQNPILIDEHETTYCIQLRGDGDYLFPRGEDIEQPETVIRDFGGRGILVGATNDDNIAFFRMHRLRNDLEVEYYRNTCDPLQEDSDIPQVMPRYHNTLWKQVLEKAYAKGGYNLALSDMWGKKAEAEIVYARTQAVIPTAGQRSEIRPGANRRLNPNYTYDRTTGTAQVRLR